MLKWTSVQSSASNVQVEDRIFNKNRRKRRTTLSNKENIVTSTPLRRPPPKIFNTSEVVVPLANPSTVPAGCKTPCRYASTLPTYEEEYSPNTIIPGQVVAMRGILPDVCPDSPRYLTSVKSEQDYQRPVKRRKIAEDDNTQTESGTSLSSSKMGDVTLDKLIDAILDSTRKDKKRRPRRSLNLRKRTLLRNTSSVSAVLSPSYTPADDPASDLSFSEIKVQSHENKSESKTRQKSYNKDSATVHNHNVKSSSYFEVGLALPSIYV